VNPGGEALRIGGLFGGIPPTDGSGFPPRGFNRSGRGDKSLDCAAKISIYQAMLTMLQIGSNSDSSNWYEKRAVAFRDALNKPDASSIYVHRGTKPSAIN
jgi:hypothetical protein